MIKYLSIQNFKSLVDTDVQLGRFNVFIGNNGSGKTSFFRSLNFLRDLVARDSINTALDDRDETFNDIVSLRANKKSISFHARVQATTRDGEAVDASYKIGVRKRRFVYVHNEEILPWDHRGALLEEETDFESLPFLMYRIKRDFMLALEPGSKPIQVSNAVFPHSFLRDVYRQSIRGRKSQQFSKLSAVARAILGYQHFEIWGPAALRAPSSAKARRLASDGSSLPSALSYLRSSNRDAFDSLLRQMRQAYPWLEEIEFRNTVNSRIALAFVERPTLKKSSPAKKYSAMQVSDGFLRMLALTTIRYSHRGVQTLAYEEPENGLHPQMIARSADSLRKIAKSGVQVLVSTHSPLFLAAVFKDSSVEDICNELRLVRRGKSGETTIDAPDSKVIESAMKHGLNLGELWSMLLGEDELASP